MILYSSDWNKEENLGAIADYDTSNTSFSDLAIKLKMMGVENNDFMLALHYPELKGIDPHSSNLTVEQVLLITVETKINPWYYVREVVRIPPIAGLDPVKFIANRANISLIWLFLNHITVLLIQPRQTGKSVSTDVLMTWLLCIRTANTTIGLLTKDDQLRVRNVYRIKNIISYLPSYFKSIRTKKDNNNTESITVNNLDNVYLTAVSQSDPKLARNIYRGTTIPIFHIDEPCYCKNIHITVPPMLSAGNAARDQAAKIGAPYGIIYTTTPGFLSDPSGEFMYEMYNECFKWTEKLFDSTDSSELEKYIRLNSPGNVPQVLLEYNHRQLGYTDEWLKRQIETARSRGEDVGPDFLNLWNVTGNAESPIDKATMEVILASQMLPTYTKIYKQGYIIRWYKSETEVNTSMLTKKLVAGIDSSEAIGSDGISLVIRDITNGEVIGVGEYNECNLHVFSGWLLELIVALTGCTFIIERKSSGGTIIDYLLDLLPRMNIDPFKRLFNWVVDEMEANPKDKEMLMTGLSQRSSSVYEMYKKHFGYATTGGGKNSRHNFYGTAFSHSVKYTCRSVRDKALISQLSNLIIKNNRIDHKAGMHDDIVVGWLIAYWFLLEAKNKQYYGIPPTSVLSSIVHEIIEEEGGIEVYKKRQEQIAIKNLIDEKLLELKTITNPYLLESAKARIMILYKQIDTTIIPSFNIQSMIDNIINEQKKSNFSIRRW